MHMRAPQLAPTSYMLMFRPTSPPAPVAASNRGARGARAAAGRARAAGPSLTDLKVALLVKRRRRRRGLRVGALAVAPARGAGLRALLPPACAPPPLSTGSATWKEP
jgi:hypothetical protein